jgi:hypothetical protein
MDAINSIDQPSLADLLIPALSRRMIEEDQLRQTRT